MKLDMFFEITLLSEALAAELADMRSNFGVNS